MPAHLHGLPVALTPLIGRDTEIARVRDLLTAQARLVTLTGPGGIGKTRLAIATVQGWSGGPGECWFVPLASIRDAALVVPTIARALELQESGERSLIEQLRALLATRPALLILDNVEQIPDLAPVVAELLDRVPTMSLLVTSRSPLNVSGEIVVPVRPLAVPGITADVIGETSSDAVTLFVARARAVRPDFALTPANGGAVAEICRRLDGLPLAIELAAARSKVLSPPALLARLTHGLALLTGGPADQPSRLRALRDTISWSYDLLSPEEQTLFRTLAVFAGTFSLDAAEAVTQGTGNRGQGTGSREQGADVSAPAVPRSLFPVPNVFDGIASLVDKSLVGVVETADDPDAEPRYRLLETVREFGVERLAESGELAAVRTAHAQWVAEFVEAGEHHFSGPGETEWQGQVTRELDNIRAALTWSIEQADAVTAQRIASALGYIWSFGGYLSEGRDWLTRSLALPGDIPDLVRARALSAAGRVAWAVNAVDEADAYLHESVALFRKLGDRDGASADLMWQSQVAWYRGDLAATADLADQAIAEVLPEPVTGWLAVAWTMRAIASMQSGHADARARLEAALEQQRRARFNRGITWTLQLIADLDHREGKLRDSIQRHQQSLELTRATGNQWALFEEFAALAYLAADSHLPREATRLMGAAATMSAISGVLPRSGRQRHGEALDLVRTALGPETFAAEQAAGMALSPLAAAEEAARIIERLLADDAPSQLDAPARVKGLLSARELEVLRLCAAGQTDQEIADSLFISHGTSRTHIRNILAKLNVSSRAAAVAYGFQHGLI